MNKTQRHTPLVRTTHWLIAVSGLLLIFSGFGQMPMYNRYFITNIPGLGWSGNFEITLLLHNIVAPIFVACVIFHIIYHLKMRELAAFPKAGDIKEGFIGFKAMIGLAAEPEHEKFQAKQRLAYAAIGLTSLILIATGLVKSYKNIGDLVLDPMLLQWMAMIHSGVAGMFVILIIIHVAILLTKGHRPLIGSMIHGKISIEYAEKHHPAWQIKG